MVIELVICLTALILIDICITQMRRHMRKYQYYANDSCKDTLAAKNMRSKEADEIFMYATYISLLVLGEGSAVYVMLMKYTDLTPMLTSKIILVLVLILVCLVYGVGIYTITSTIKRKRSKT